MAGLLVLKTNAQLDADAEGLAVTLALDQLRLDRLVATPW